MINVRCLVVFALFALPSMAAPTALERIRARGELRWAGDLQGGEPYVFRSHEDPNKLVGFEVELAEGLAKRLGVKAVFVQNDWHNLIPSLERGDFDIAINGIEDVPPLHGRVLMTRPYYTFTEQLVVREGSPYKSLADLRGKRVGTLGESLAHLMLRAQNSVELKLYEGQEEPYRDLKLGRHEGVHLDSVIAARYGLMVPRLMLAD
ncbi:MAG: amino acid ABC transporter substrate-binding protein, partial [Deltaproteobacteria bacterium]|nr:amino acid ABC transporter substrate-binding protein [Deltaproteobacteria bacterium]